jgi:hypothetical protein
MNPALKIPEYIEFLKHTTLMASDAPADSIIFSQLLGNPSLLSMYCATCLRMISMPGESVYDPVRAHFKRTVILQNAQVYSVPKKHSYFNFKKLNILY